MIVKMRLNVVFTLLHQLVSLKWITGILSTAISMLQESVSFEKCYYNLCDYSQSNLELVFIFRTQGRRYIWSNTVHNLVSRSP